jgi:sulfur-oxidizing protein SoxZ
MALKKPPRIKVPERITAGEVVEIKTLATHIMETGNRKDAAGNKIPRDIIHTFTATFEGQPVFSADLGPGIAANPYIAFYLKVPGPGTLELTWLDDAGDATVAQVALNVV